jgi:GxxExxY protein
MPEITCSLTTPEQESIARKIVDSAFTVHSALGPGLLESIYEQCLAYELESRGIMVARQSVLPVIYREIRIDSGFRIDMLVGDLVVVEVKAVEGLLPVHEAQILTYLKLSGHRLGFLINFNVARISQGIRRFIR